jgi:hypothetical protein
VITGSIRSKTSLLLCNSAKKILAEEWMPEQVNYIDYRAQSGPYTSRLKLSPHLSRRGGSLQAEASGKALTSFLIALECRSCTLPHLSHWMILGLEVCDLQQSRNRRAGKGMQPLSEHSLAATGILVLFDHRAVQQDC